MDKESTQMIVETAPDKQVAKKKKLRVRVATRKGTEEQAIAN